MVQSKRSSTRCRGRYVVLTAARNEERFIRSTITSLVSQTVKPVRWIVASDNSTDRTDEIVLAAAHTHPWITLLRLADGEGRGFDAKARAIAAAYASVGALDFEVVVNMDADVTFGPDFCAYLLRELGLDARIGVAGTRYTERDQLRLKGRFSNQAEVPGQIQFFRRECFDAIGGYDTMRRGGVDTVAVVRARMAGWETRVFAGETYEHHRAMGTGGRGGIAASLMYGERAYLLGGHPLWETARAISHVGRHPYIVAAMLEAVGYWAAAARNLELSVPPEVVAFRRHEQMQRVKQAAATLLRPRATNDLAE
jgi:biofilm PGA synthesis N-glycosyltransferase PgaC